MRYRHEEKKNRIILPSPLGHIRPCPIVTDPQGCFAGKPIEAREMPLEEGK